MSKYTKQDIIRLVQDEDVEFIRLQFVDIFGTLKNTAVTTSQLDKILNNKCAFDGGAIEGFFGSERTELFLYPDLDTFEIFPWRPQQGKVARFICNVYNSDGTHFEGDSRYILKRVLAKAEEKGYTVNVGPECEFFLFDEDEQGDATTHTNEKGGYFDIGPTDMGENARREMVLTLEQMGFEVESSFHADAPAQHEIDFKYADALKTADNIITFKLAVRTVAKRHGLHATFMPKPKQGVKGSGMHITMSISKDGRNIFSDKDGIGISAQASSFIAGIMEHISALTVINNPIVNSYKRLVPGYEAPVCIGWSQTNCSPLIRVFAIDGEGTKVELRSPDVASNPYLVLAGCIAAGLDGMERKLPAKESFDYRIQEMSAKEIKAQGVKVLPSNLYAAIQAFEEDEFMKYVFGEHITNKYICAKREEWEQYCLQVSAWEVEHYLYII